MQKFAVNVGDKFIATQVNQTIEIKEFFVQKKKNGKKTQMMKVEIIRNEFPGEHEVNYETFYPALLDDSLYESFV